MSTPSLGERIKARRDARHRSPALMSAAPAELERRLAELEARVAALEDR